MALLLTILSVLAVWTFLTVLVLGLLLIFKVLEGVKHSLEQITMGVRAIERQTHPLDAQARRFGMMTTETASAYASVAEALEQVDARLDQPLRLHGA